MRREIALPLILLLAAGLACRATTHTTIGEDASGSVSTTLEVPLDEDQDPSEVDCDQSDSLPPGATTRREVDGDTVRCIWEAPFADLQELQDIYDSNQEIASAECLVLLDGRLIYDVRLNLDESQSGEVEGLEFQWILTAPGAIDSHNADEQQNQTLTWNLQGAVGERHFQVNLDPQGRCPTAPLRLAVLVDNEGTGGHATLEAPVLPTGPEDTQALVDQLTQAGWQVSGPAPGAASFEARQTWGSVGEFEALFQTLPPLTGSSSKFTLILEEDKDSDLRRFQFSGTFDFEGYAAYWEGVSPKLQPPDFEFEYFPAGSVDAISGDWTDNIQLLLNWDPDSGAVRVPLRARSIYDPQLSERLSPEELEEKLDDLKDRFKDEIPPGQITQNPSTIQSILATIFPPGTANNMTNWTEWACGDYQTKVLTWLDDIRTHSDPAVRSQLGGLDYGPVQAYAGGHQAVVVFPRGTDWRETGTVLDPWPEQRPRSFTMEEWRDRFSWGHGVGESGENYPHMRRGSPAYPINVGKGRLHPRRIGVNSPVVALVTDSEGRRLGMLPDGSYVNEIPGADFYPEPKGDGEHQWYFGLPEGAYDLTLTGTGDGDVHVLVADENERLVTFGPQAITEGGVAGLNISPEGINEPLLLPSGEPVEPVEVTEANVGEIDFGQPASAGPEATTSLPPNRLPLLLVMVACTWAPFAALWTIVALRWGRKNGS